MGKKKGKLRWLEGHRGKKTPRMYLLNGTKITGVKGKICTLRWGEG